MMFVSKGCKYMLIRGNRNKIATLKRVPTEKELSMYVYSCGSLLILIPLSSFDISMYPNSSEFLTESKWRSLYQKQSELNKQGPKIRDLVKSLGDRGDKIISKLFEVSLLCRCRCCCTHTLPHAAKDEEQLLRSEVL